MPHVTVAKPRPHVALVTLDRPERMNATDRAMHEELPLAWRALEENPLDFLPLRAAAAHLPPQPALDSDGPGPFSFADADRVNDVLGRAGFGEIAIEARDEKVGSGDLEAMLAVCSRVGVLGKILRENPGLREAALPAVRSALAAHDGPDGVKLNAATWIVTARVPA